VDLSASAGVVVMSPRPIATVSIDLDPIDVHLRGYGHHDLRTDPLVHATALPRLLESLGRHGVRATFFVLGRAVPAELATLVAIRDAGHEVASHGIDHLAGLGRRSDSEMREELLASRDRISEHSGADVVGFRAPDWSASRRLMSALVETGYRYDASLLPSMFLPAGRMLLAIRARSLQDMLAVRPPPSLRRLPYQWRLKHGLLAEFPLAVTPLLRYPLYHTLRPTMSDQRFTAHLDGFVRRGEPFSYALHGVDVLGLEEDDVDRRLGAHPGMSTPLRRKLELLDSTLAALAARFEMRPYGDRLDEWSRPGRSEVGTP
jgi:peptidoglycan/xylan/chitin deacetylase (PgdA/CDA1 family)